MSFSEDDDRLDYLAVSDLVIALGQWRAAADVALETGQNPPALAETLHGAFAADPAQSRPFPAPRTPAWEDAQRGVAGARRVTLSPTRACVLWSARPPE